MMDKVTEKLLTVNDYSEIQSAIQNLSPVAREFINTLIEQSYKVNPVHPEKVAESIVDMY